MGGTESLAKMSEDRREEKDVHKVILEETSVHPFTEGQA
jgi:hypothetical protein